MSTHSRSQSRCVSRPLSSLSLAACYELAALKLTRNITSMKLRARQFLTEIEPEKPFFLYVGWGDCHRCGFESEIGTFCEFYGSPDHKQVQQLNSCVYCGSLWFTLLVSPRLTRSHLLCLLLMLSHSIRLIYSVCLTYDTFDSRFLCHSATVPHLVLSSCATPLLWLSLCRSASRCVTTSMNILTLYRC